MMKDAMMDALKKKKQALKVEIMIGKPDGQEDEKAKMADKTSDRAPEVKDKQEDPVAEDMSGIVGDESEEGEMSEMEMLKKLLAHEEDEKAAARNPGSMDQMAKKGMRDKLAMLEKGKKY